MREPDPSADFDKAHAMAILLRTCIRFGLMCKNLSQNQKSTILKGWLKIHVASSSRELGREIRRRRGDLE